MAIAASHVTGGGSTADGNSFSTASITPTANALMFAAIVNRTAAGAGTITLSGNGLTWVELGAILLNNDTPARLTVFRAMGASPSTGVVTISVSNTAEGISWNIEEFTGVDTGGTNGSGAVGTPFTAFGNTTPHTINMGGAATVDHAWAAAYGVIGTRPTPAGTWVELGDNVSGSPATCSETQWDTTGDETTCAPTGSNADWAGLVVEIKDPELGHPTMRRWGGNDAMTPGQGGMWAPRRKRLFSVPALLMPRPSLYQKAA